MPGIEPQGRSSRRAVSALNRWVLSSSPTMHFLKNPPISHRIFFCLVNILDRHRSEFIQLTLKKWEIIRKYTKGSFDVGHVQAICDSSRTSSTAHPLSAEPFMSFMFACLQFYQAHYQWESKSKMAHQLGLPGGFARRELAICCNWCVVLVWAIWKHKSIV